MHYGVYNINIHSYVKDKTNLYITKILIVIKINKTLFWLKLKFIVQSGC
jgi:hypothetical protein